MARTPRPQPEPLTDEQWQAVIGNDAAYDGRFVYAVRTTGVFCRPSCKSRPPNRANIGSFRTAGQALAAHYRPCKRCKPSGGPLPDEEWIAAVTAYIDRNSQETLTLEHLAAISHGTPYHLHRTFKRITGITPAAYIQRARIAQAKALLISSRKPVAEIGKSVGLSNVSYFITLFKKMTGHTPQGYRLRVNRQMKEPVP